MAQAEKIGIALSGGGAKGAFQAGALRWLKEQGYSYHAVAGVSVGALNGAFVAARKVVALHTIWERITQSDVYRKKKWYELAWEFAKWKMGIGGPVDAVYDNGALAELIARNIMPSDIKLALEIGRVDIDTGKYHSGLYGHDVAKFHKVLLASTSIPVVWPPVRIENEPFVDGGLVNIAPLADLIDNGCDRIIAITTEPLGFKRSLVTNDLFNIARKSIGILTHEVFINDIKSVENVNNLVGQAQSKGIQLRKPGSDRYYRHIDIDVITPETPIGSGLDFSRRHLNNLLSLGYEAAQNALGANIYEK